jgi:predicted nucleic acid-binding protein
VQLDEVLFDSNIVARFLDADHSEHSNVRAAIDSLTNQGYVLCFVPQVTFELHNFLTRPTEANGLGLSVGETSRRLDQLERVFRLRCPDAHAEYVAFRELARELQPIGKKVHDLRLVASARVLGIPKFLTLNRVDFRRASAAGYIEVLTPTDVRTG